MSWRTATVVLALSVCLASANAAHASLCVGVEYRFSGRTPPDALVRSMQEEASTLWGLYGLHILWAGVAPAPVCTHVDGTFEVVVRRGVEWLRPHQAHVVLGRTHLEASAIDHTLIHIEYDAVEQTARGLTPDRLQGIAHVTSLGPSEIGRALGRVLAHEIGHVVLAAARHPPGGLMRAAFRPEDLVGLDRQSFTLSPGEVERLRARERFLESRVTPGQPRAGQNPAPAPLLVGRKP